MALGGELRKTIAILATTCLLVLAGIPAAAARSSSIKVGNLITVTYPSSVKLKKSGCQLIPFTYKVGNMAGFDRATVHILDDEESLLGGGDLYYTPQFAGIYKYKVLEKSGKVNIRICRTDFRADLGHDGYEDSVGATKGEFLVYVTTARQDNLGEVKFF